MSLTPDSVDFSILIIPRSIKSGGLDMMIGDETFMELNHRNPVELSWFAFNLLPFSVVPVRARGLDCATQSVVCQVLWREDVGAHVHGMCAGP